MPPRLHSGGRFRAWLGRSLTGDPAAGDRLWRRILHTLGALVLVYYLFPTDFFVIAPKAYILLGVLGFVLLLEVLRHAAGLELPTLRAYEQHRVGSYVFFSVALAGAVLLFPIPIACAVVLGVALVDPIAGELRDLHVGPAWGWALPVSAYFGLAVVGMYLLGGWPLSDALALAAVAAPIAVAVERPKLAWLDDDLAMAFVPGLVLYALAILGFGLTR